MKMNGMTAAEQLQRITEEMRLPADWHERDPFTLPLDSALLRGSEFIGSYLVRQSELLPDVKRSCQHGHPVPSGASCRRWG
jgi:hypothetical protein